MVCSGEKWYFFSTSTQILDSLYVPGHTFSSMSKVHIKAIEKHYLDFFFIFVVDRKIAIFLNLMSLSFIGNMPSSS